MWTWTYSWPLYEGEGVLSGFGHQACPVIWQQATALSGVDFSLYLSSLLLPQDWEGCIVFYSTPSLGEEC